MDQRLVRRFRNILFSPLANRGNAAPARRVAELAARNGSTLTVFGAVPEPSGLQRLLHRDDRLNEIQTAQRDDMAERLASSVPSDAAIEISTKLADGDPGLSIIRQVLRGGHDLVVVTTDDDDEDHASVNRLLRKCPCPVWIIRPTRARTQRVLAAVNPDPDELELNRTILELAASMVELFGGELEVAHAWELYGEATLRSSAFLHTPTEELDALLATEEAAHHARLDELLATTGLDDLPWKVHLRKGPAEHAIPSVVSSQRTNLLVMGTVARTGVSGLLIGNTAETILDNVRCSVVAVKPPGFVCPVEA